MNKNIVIIGAGISGLSLLYFLRKKYAGRGDVKITLLEKSDHTGGNIRTVRDSGCLFECGPNGFLSNAPATLELIEELGLNPDLIEANPSAKKRFVLIDQTLHAFPMDPAAFFAFKPMTFIEKLRVFAEPFIPRGRESNEAVYDFAKRRFGVKVARYFLDPMVSGIYAGDSEFLSIAHAFPKIYDLEQRHGSVIRGLMASRGPKGKGKMRMRSLRNGMSQLTDALAQRGNDAVRLNEPVLEIIRAEKYYLVVTQKEKYAADELFVCTPSHVTSEWLGKLHHDLAVALKSIDYAPVAVVGLLFDAASLQRAPVGFGHLIPSTEESLVLGVLAESNVFEGRAGQGQVMLRVMIGGSRNPECVRKSREELMAIALEEIKARYGLKAQPLAQFFVAYPRAIPQYETAYGDLKRRIEKGLRTLPHLHLLANYRNGVSMNDCIRNARETAERTEI